MGAHYQFGYHLSKFFARTLFDFRVIHRERIIEDGPAILAMNHQSYLDPPLAGLASHREIYFLARKTLLQWPLIGPILPKLNVIAVNQERADMSALKAVIKVVRAGHCALIFPEGSRTVDGHLERAQPGLGFVMAKTSAPVVPMRIFNAHKAFPRHGAPRFFTPITIVVGEPIMRFEIPSGTDGRALYAQLSERVMERIAALELPPE